MNHHGIPSRHDSIFLTRRVPEFGNSRSRERVPGRGRDFSSWQDQICRGSGVSCAELFKVATGHEPFPYQRRLAEANEFPHLLSIPTGAGRSVEVSRLACEAGGPPSLKTACFCGRDCAIQALY